MIMLTNPLSVPGIAERFIQLAIRYGCHLTDVNNTEEFVDHALNVWYHNEDAEEYDFIAFLLNLHFRLSYHIADRDIDATSDVIRESLVKQYAVEMMVILSDPERFDAIRAFGWQTEESYQDLMFDIQGDRLPLEY